MHNEQPARGRSASDGHVQMACANGIAITCRGPGDAQAGEDQDDGVQRNGGAAAGER